MSYTVNDAVSILYMCGIHTIPTLHKHLTTGGFKIAESTLKKKVAILRAGQQLEDHRKYNFKEPYLTENRLKKLKTKHDKAPEASAPQLLSKAKFKCTPRTINRGLQKVGFKYMRIHTVPYMKPIHITQRINFAKEHLNDRKWRRTFFLDESSFQAYSHKKYCYQNPKERISKPRPKHAPNILQKFT